MRIGASGALRVGVILRIQPDANYSRFWECATHSMATSDIFDSPDTFFVSGQRLSPALDTTSNPSKNVPAPVVDSHSPTDPGTPAKSSL